MKLVVDMNLTIEWVKVLRRRGFEVKHWREVGRRDAPDTEILSWARENGSTVFTNDLDFGRLLALTRSKGPSVLQLRGGALLPEDAEESVVSALQQCHIELKAGALVTVDEAEHRVRVLPIK